METVISDKFIVCVGCMTFNHRNYIEDTLNGFTMQETKSPFVCTIIDDASTDGEQEIIMNYLDEHFELEDKSTVRRGETDDYVLTFARHKTNHNCFFAVLLLKYNHYSIRKSKAPYMTEWQDDSKYTAICEGDDYWIDSHKLQRQYEFLDTHPEFVMVCNRTKRYSERQQKFISDSACYEQEQVVKTEDVIIKGGLFISTCSVLFNHVIYENYPTYCSNCHVGDYPLQIMCAMKGKIYYINDPMAVYRVENPNSWVGRQKEKVLSEGKIKGIMSEIRMLQGFKKDYPKYSSVFKERIKLYLSLNMPYRKVDPVGFKKYIKTFRRELKMFDKRELVRLMIYHYGGSTLNIYKKYIKLKR